MSVNSIHLSYDIKNIMLIIFYVYRVTHIVKTEKKLLENYRNYIARFSSKISRMPVQETIQTVFLLTSN